MSTIFVLIMVIGGSGNGGLTSFTQEFSSQQACIAALNGTVAQWNEYNRAPIRYHGCYAKGSAK